MTNKTTQVVTSNSVEELRQKLNDISLDVGANSELVSTFTDAVTEVGTTRSAGNHAFATTTNFNLNSETVYDSVGANSVTVGSYDKGNVLVSSNSVDLVQGVDAGNYYVPHQTFVINHNAPQDWSTHIGEDITQSGSSWAGGKLVYVDGSIIVVFGSSTNFTTTNQLQLAGATSINGISLLSTEELSGQARAVRLVTAAGGADDIQLANYDAVVALNELMIDIGDITLLNADITDKTDLVSAINAEEAELNTAQEEIQVLENRLGLGYIADEDALDTAAVTVIGAISELHTDQETIQSRIGAGFIADNSTLSLAGTTLSGAVNSLLLRTGVGETLGVRDQTLATTATNNVSAINELHTEINALGTDKLDLTSVTSQTLDSDVTVPSGNTITINGSLDVSGGTFITGGGAGEITFANRFISLGDDTEITPNAAGGGLEIDRGVGSNAVQVRWNETDADWQMSVADGTFYDVIHKGNLGDVFDGGTESGISIEYNSSNDGVDIALDTQAAYTAGEFGSSSAIPVFTVNDKGIVTAISTSDISTTLSMKNTGGSTFTTALGSDTLIIDGTTNEVEVTIADDNVTIGLPDDVTITGDLFVNDYARIDALRIGTTSTDPGDGNLHVEGDAYIAGDLDVDGTINFVDSTTVNIGDNNIVLNAAVTGVPPVVQSGISIERGDEANAELVFDESTDTWQVNPGSGSYVELLTDNSTISNAVAPIDASSINADMDIAFLDSSGNINDHAANLTYNPTVNSGTLTAGTFIGELTGNAATATGLANGRNITVNSVDHYFNGTANVDLTEAIYDAVGAMVSGGTTSGITITHQDGSDDIDFEVTDVHGFGEITNDSTTVSAANGDDSIAIVGGDDITIGGNNTSKTLTVDHDDITRTNSTDASPDGTAITTITSNARGHITAVESFDFDDRYLQSYSASGDVAITTGGASTIGARKVLASMLPSVATDTFFGRTAVGAGSMSALSVTEAKEMLDITDVENDANHYAIKTGHDGGTGADLADGGTINISGSGATSITRTGSSYTISSSNTTYSVGANLDLVANQIRLEPGNIVDASVAGDVLSLTRQTDTGGSEEIITFTGGASYIAESGGGIGLNSTTNAFRLANDHRLTSTQVVSGSNLSHFIFNDTAMTARVGNVSVMSLTNDGLLRVGGDIVAFSTSLSSDRKLKENITNVTDALGKVCQLNGVEFDWKDGRGKSAGVIAQDVEKVLPQAVKQTEDFEGNDYKTVDYNQLSSLMIEAIKELKEENKELRLMIEELKGK